MSPTHRPLAMEEKTYFGEPGDFVRVRHLKIRGTNFEIGRALGKLAAERYGKTPAHFAANPLFARARRLYIERNFPIFQERTEGVAAAFGLDPDDDRYDLTCLPYFMDAPGFECSTVYYPPNRTATGHGYLSRNYDFFVGSMADVMHGQIDPNGDKQSPALMSEPYVMEWYPQDGGYASIAIHAFDLLGGTLDGLNSEGLVVSILSDDEARAELGSKLEPHIGPFQFVGLHELSVMRLLLDTCSTAAEAKEALLIAKQHYLFTPCHYIVADRTGKSFVYEISTGRNVQHVIETEEVPQVLTNFQLHKHPTADTRPGGNVTIENEAFWRHRRLTDQVSAQSDAVTAEEIRDTHSSVNILNVMATTPIDSPLRNLPVRTLWHNIYDQQAGTVEISFYLGDEKHSDGSLSERRSDYKTFTLKTD